jgi:serine/threonine-protein kinase
MASSPMPLAAPHRDLARTRQLLRNPHAGTEEPDTTDYELSASTARPDIRFRDSVAAPATRVLDPATARQFHERLRLCCMVAAAPFAFFLLCGLTNFVELFGRETIGWTGVVLSGVVLLGLGATAAYLFRVPPLPVPTLRVIEVATFGTMSLFFAYWQFTVLTGMPAAGFEGRNSGARHMESVVMAAAGIVHFNWFALIVFHAVLVPNTLARGASITAAMVAVALGIDTAAAILHVPAALNAPALFAISCTMLAAAAGLSVFGTAKTVELQREVESAREAVRELGQYRLRKKLGSGGMGEVYLAEHRLLKRPCAVKRIHAKYLNNPEQLKRFEREVQATAQLRHPNTVEIYDYGVADDGTFYYVMEYLPGVSLEELVGRFGPQPPERTVHILRQVCGALREAHRHGLVHRDIKPSNILLFAEGSPHDQVKLVDFGLVHSLWENDPGGKITREGLIVGTPEYMSPEQASGSSLDGRSDLFSLGSVAYYLLTGREAFHRENAMKTLMAVVTDTPAPVADANPYVPADVLAVLTRCLSKDAGERYATATDLDAALAACGCAAQWTEPRASDWWAVHPAALPGTGTDLDTLPLRD